MDIAERIFSEMKRKGLTQRDLAELLDMTQSSIAHWKGRGSKISIDLIPTICNILEISPNYLLTGEESAEHYTEDEKRLIEQYRKLDTNNKTEVIQYTTFKAQTSAPLRERITDVKRKKEATLALTNAVEAIDKAAAKGIYKPKKKTKQATIKKEAPA